MSGDPRRGRIMAVGTVVACVAIGAAVGTERYLMWAVAAAGLTLVLTARDARRSIAIGWVVLSVLVQEAARRTAVGYALNAAVYVVPALVLAAWSLAASPRRRWDWLDLAPVLFIVISALSLLFNPYVAGADKQSYATMLLLNSGVPVAAYYIGRTRAADRLTDRDFTTALAAAAGVACVFAATEWLTGFHLWGFEAWQVGLVGRVTSPLTNPTVLGTVLAGGACAGVALAVDVRRRPWDRPFGTFLCLLTGGLTLTTFTRSAVLAWLASVGLVLWFRYRSRALAWAVAAVILVAAPAAWLDVVLPDAIRRRILEESNAVARVAIAQVSLKLALLRPVFGWGYGAFDVVKGTQVLGSADVPSYYTAANTSHNTFLTILVETGPLGLVAYVAAVAGSVVRGLRSARSGWHAGSAVQMGMVVAWLLNSLAMDMRFFSYATMLMFLAAGLLRSDPGEEAAE